MFRFLIGTTLLFILLTAVMTYPQVWHMADGISDMGDPLLNLWTLGWVAHQLPIAPAHLFDGNIFYPERHTLAYSETLLAPAVFASPLLWMGVSRVLVYNIVMVTGFIASGVGTALLVRDLTRSVGASIVAGVVFAFLPVRFDHYGQLQLQQAGMDPAVTLGLSQVDALRPAGRRTPARRIRRRPTALVHVLTASTSRVTSSSSAAR